MSQGLDRVRKAARERKQDPRLRANIRSAEGAQLILGNPFYFELLAASEDLLDQRRNIEFPSGTQRLIRRDNR
jgi:hypothetical protein